jgi:hypothetical protein
MPRRRTLSEQVTRFAIAAITTTLAAACGVIDPQSCTAIGCSDGAALQLQAADGSRTAYEMTLVVDGQEVTCTSPTLSEPNGVSVTSCSDSMISVSHQQLADCAETRTAGSVSQSCVPNGQFAQTISFQGTPSRVAVTLVNAAGTTFQRTFDLEYTTSTPNGPECGPACSQARAEWLVQ